MRRLVATPADAGEICVDRRLSPLGTGSGVAAETHVFMTLPSFSATEAFEGPCPG